MYGFVRVAAATPKTQPAAVKQNADNIIELVKSAEKKGVRLTVFPELALSGYTCGDLFLQTTLISACESEMVRVASYVKKSVVVVGMPAREGGKLYNVACVLAGGKIIGAVPKINLPNYGEFYELRNFASGESLYEITINGLKVPCRRGLVFRDSRDTDFSFGVEICEDMWVADSPSIALVKGGANIICNPSASVETVGKAEFRRLLVQGHSAKLMCGYIYADCGAGESTTDCIFAGHRIIVENGSILSESELLTEGLTIAEIDLNKIDFSRRGMNTFRGGERAEYVEFESEDFDGELVRKINPTPFIPEDEKRCELILSLQAAGLKRRMSAANIKKLVVGVSGGLDSTLALLVSLRAAEKSSDVTAVTMPCFGTGERTLKNVRRLCNELKVDFREVPIGGAVSGHFADIGHDPSVMNAVYENAQARERTQVLLDIANEIGGIVVGTGDMSELALGWCTYGGDQMSSYGVNGSIPKTLVKKLVEYEAERKGGADGEVLFSIAKTEVSPELLPPVDGKISQRTEEILGKYIYHDFILYYAIRWGFSPKKILFLALNAFGEDKKAEFVAAMKVFFKRFFSQQFKRSCMPDGVKVGTVSLSPRSDFRMPSDASAKLWLAEIADVE